MAVLTAARVFCVAVAWQPVVSAAAAVVVGAAVDEGTVCRPGDASEGACSVDGSGCSGERVTFGYTEFDLKRWDPATRTETRVGEVPSYALTGAQNTWQMYLHGPQFRQGERPAGDVGLPPVYVFGTWVNKIYRFDNFSTPARGASLTATQKVVGHALAPSTAWPVEDASGGLRGFLVAEGQPWWFSSLPFPREVYKGGVDYLPVGHVPNCTQIFPETGMHRMFGQVVNTVDCHRGTGVCFFTVWKFYDDQWPIWTNTSEEIAPDCLYYCLADRLDDRPTCSKIGVVTNEHGQQVCHRDGKGAVHGMTIGNTDPSDPSQFDIFLVYTGRMTFTKGDSSMEKVRVQVAKPSSHSQRDLRVLSTAAFGEDLFRLLPAPGMDAGGDHAWVDATGKWVWVSTFRESAAGVHMLSYDTGRLVYSVRGIEAYLDNQYAYPAGIHGVGTIGRAGSWLALATSACHSAELCAPIPWVWPVPRNLWAAGVFFLLDLSRLPVPEAEGDGQAVYV